MLRNLSTALFDKERITTTLTRAKELRPFAERLVTLSKQETLHARRRVARHIQDRKVVAKLFDTLSARYATRPGGYTRILRLGPRRGDNAEQALIELVGAETAAAGAAATKEAAEAPGTGRGGAKAGAKAPAATKAKAKTAEGKKAAAKPARSTAAKPAAAAKKTRSAADGSAAERRRAPSVAKRGPSGKKGGD
jgi:large subunit ribosomal protein L17